MADERKAAEIRNWLADLAIGAKAGIREIQYGNESWQTSSTYQTYFIDGAIVVLIHDIKELAKAADLDVVERDLTDADYYGDGFSHEIAVYFNGVKFVDMTIRRKEETENDWQ